MSSPTHVILKSKLLNSIHLNQFKKNSFSKFSNIRGFATEGSGGRTNDQNHLSATSTTYKGEFKDVDQEQLDPVFLEPEKIRPTCGHVVCQLHFRSYIPGPMDFFIDFARRVAHALRMPCSGSIPLPTQTSRWTLIKGPFVHKKSQENFERKTHKRLLNVKDTNREVVERWIWYLTKNCPAGVGMRVTLWEWEKLGVGKEMLKKASSKEKRMLKDVENMQEVDARDAVVEVANMIIKEMEKNLNDETKSADDS